MPAAGHPRVSRFGSWYASLVRFVFANLCHSDPIDATALLFCSYHLASLSFSRVGCSCLHPRDQQTAAAGSHHRPNFGSPSSSLHTIPYTYKPLSSPHGRTLTHTSHSPSIPTFTTAIMGNKNRKQVRAYNPDEIERYVCLIWPCSND